MCKTKLPTMYQRIYDELCLNPVWQNEWNTIMNPEGADMAVISHAVVTISEIVASAAVEQAKQDVALVELEKTKGF
jgi:hypothetical protein